MSQTHALISNLTQTKNANDWFFNLVDVHRRDETIAITMYRKSRSLLLSRYPPTVCTTFANRSHSPDNHFHCSKPLTQLFFIKRFRQTNKSLRVMFSGQIGPDLQSRDPHWISVLFQG